MIYTINCIIRNLYHNLALYFITKRAAHVVSQASYLKSIVQEYELEILVLVRMDKTDIGIPVREKDFIRRMQARANLHILESEVQMAEIVLMRHSNL